MFCDGNPARRRHQRRSRRNIERVQAIPASSARVEQRAVDVGSNRLTMLPKRARSRCNFSSRLALHSKPYHERGDLSAGRFSTENLVHCSLYVGIGQVMPRDDLFDCVRDHDALPVGSEDSQLRISS